MATPMQPVYLTGHSRPVHKVMHNLEGDLLFSCSDDGTVCMYDTTQLIRIGVFHVKEACRSIDITKDSKWLIAAATTVGFHIYDVSNGRIKATVNVPGLFSKQVALAFGDQILMCLYDNEKRSYIRLYDMPSIFRGEEPKVLLQIDASKDYLLTNAVWGPKNETLIVSTNIGKILVYNLEHGQLIEEKAVHAGDIFSLTITNDYTMLVSSGKDGVAKLLHPETLQVIREFNYGKPCRSAVISPIFEDPNHQKFHIIVAGGQDAKDVTTTDATAGGFEMKMINVIFNEKLAEIHGHFGPVHCVSFSPDGFAFASAAEDGYVHYHRFPPEYFSKKFE